MSEEIAFEHLPDKQIPDKGDIKDEKMTESILTKITKEKKEEKLREETGTAPPAKGSFTRDVPQLAFRICAEKIPCSKFALSDEDATTFAHHLNILIPLEGKMISLVVILMIIANKVFLCRDAIFKKKPDQQMGNEEAGLPKKEEVPSTRTEVF